MTDKIVACGLRTGYAGRGGPVVEVLQGVDLAVRQGEFLSILGPSGCGKSTFLNILAGLVPRTGGELWVDGRPAEGVGAQQGVVFQGYALFPWLNVRDNVAVGLEIRGMARRERLQRAQAQLERVGLAAFGERYPHELSGGMKQRVAIARVLAYDPEVLLMDEPFGALDAQTRELLQAELLRLWDRSRKTIVFVTHSLDEAVFLSDRIAVMTHRPGRIKTVLDVDLPRPRTPELRHTAAFTALRRRAWEVLRDEVEAAAPVAPAGGRTAVVHGAPAAQPLLQGAVR